MYVHTNTYTVAYANDRTNGKGNEVTFVFSPYVSCEEHQQTRGRADKTLAFVAVHQQAIAPIEAHFCVLFAPHIAQG